MLINTIGNTPMIKINYEYKEKNKYIYTKLEYYNLTGSIKDRVAYYIINNAMKRGELKEGMPIIEATSGNTGIALAALGRFYNHPVYIFMPDWVSKERKDLIRNYGANIILFSKADEKIDNPIVTVFADDNKKYLSTDLAKDIDENSDFVSNKIKLKNYKVIN